VGRTEQTLHERFSHCAGDEMAHVAALGNHAVQAVDILLGEFAGWRVGVRLRHIALQFKNSSERIVAVAEAG
jgi:hypothetical protein